MLLISWWGLDTTTRWHGVEGGPVLLSDGQPFCSWCIDGNRMVKTFGTHVIQLIDVFPMHGVHETTHLR